MSSNNEEEFQLILNDKNYLINICILEDQLSLVLTLLVMPPKQYSGFFSLKELRISSKIFHHTNSLFEAKEILKRTVIKKQLFIIEDDHKAKIIFDTGLGMDSIPFPIILFRDLNVNHLRTSQILTDFKKNNENNKNYSRNINQMQNIDNNISNYKNKRVSNSFSQKNIIRPSIGNNNNNKMILNNNNIKAKLNTNKQIIKGNDYYNITLDNFKKNNSNNLEKIIFNNRRSKKIIIKRKNDKDENMLSYKQVELTSNNNKNLINNYNNNNRNILSINKNILYRIYNNMNYDNNINSSFYKNLKNSFSSYNINDNNQNYNINNKLINNNTNIKNINNDTNDTKSHLQQNINIQSNNGSKNVYDNYLNINTLQNKVKNPNIYNSSININPTDKIILNNRLNDASYNQNIHEDFFNRNLSPKTSPNDNNINYITNNGNMIANNDENLLNENIPKDNPRNKISLLNYPSDNKKKYIRIYNVVSEGNENINDDEDNVSQKEYKFKNLIIKTPERIKGNLEKFRQSQNMGNYIPSGKKFVSYLKFPDTKSIRSSNNVSTLSSSIVSSLNRIPGIEKNIIKYPSELDEITARIKITLNKKKIKFKMIYKGTVDGDLSTTFHSKCDNINNTLILIYTSCNKRFGGFTTQTWDGENIYKKDDNSFIFSIDKLKVYDIRKGKNAINCNPDLGPIFINQIKLLDKFFTQGGMTSIKGYNYKTIEDYELTGGAEKFGIKEVEVYYVI